MHLVERRFWFHLRAPIELAGLKFQEYDFNEVRRDENL